MTMALCNPIKFFSAHDKKSSTSQEADLEVSPAVAETNVLPIQPEIMGGMWKLVC